MLKWSIEDACAWIGPKVASSKEAEAGRSSSLWKKVIEKVYARIQVCFDAIEVVQAINNKFDWVINPIIVDIKKLFLNFMQVQFLTSLEVLTV